MVKTVVKIKKSSKPKTIVDKTQSLTSAEVPRTTKSKHKWTESEILLLIAGVKMRPQLWAEESKSGRAEDWKDMLSELGIDGVGWIEVRKKWSDLRKKLIVSTTTSKGKKPKWAKYMSFLGNKTEPSSTEKSGEIVASNSLHPFFKVEVNSASKRRSIQNTPTSIGGSSFSVQDLNVGPPSKRRCIEAVLTSNKVSSSTPCVSSTLSTSKTELHAQDPNSTFCEHLLAELRMLSEIESRHLRRLLMQVAYDFGDFLEEQSATV